MKQFLLLLLLTLSFPYSVIAQNSYTITGSLTLVDSEIRGSNTDCYGSGGYSDIRGGMGVTIRDETGKVIAVGKTDLGHRQEGRYASVVCIFPFQITNIPKASFYSIEVGRRGQINYSFAELEQQEWTVDFSLSR